MRRRIGREDVPDPSRSPTLRSKVPSWAVDNPGHGITLGLGNLVSRRRLSFRKSSKYDMTTPCEIYRDRLLTSPLALQLLGASGVEEEFLEKRLVAEFLGDEVGSFVEVGANHPFIGSQSYHLELAGWRGILVEPLGELAEVLRRERPLAHVARCACTRPGGPPTVVLHIPHEHGFATVEPNKDDFGIRYHRSEEVPARTLDEVIDAWRAATGEAARIRFLSVDVEGHEMEVLRGFSLERHQPDLVLIEDKLQNLVKHRYLTTRGYRLVRRTGGLNNWYVPAGKPGPDVSAVERLRLLRKMYLGLPFRMFHRWRHRRASASHAAGPG